MACNKFACNKFHKLKINVFEFLIYRINMIDFEYYT